MMKSKKFFIMALSIAIISVISNGSVFAAPAEKYKVVDKSGGKKAKDPKWYSTWVKNRDLMEVEKAYENKHAFIIEQEGDNLDFLKVWANKIDASSQVARLLSNQIEEIAAGSEYGDDGDFQKAMESLVTSLSKAKVVGLRKNGDWWVKKQYTSGPNKNKMAYSYSVLYLIDKDNIKKLLDREIKKALGEVTTHTRERVTEVIDNSGVGKSDSPNSDNSSEE